MTFGASDTRCSEPPPTDVAAALYAKPDETGGSLFYREEIYHPAFEDPVITRGWFEISDDGSLIRHQTEPIVETSRINERFIFLQHGEIGGSNIYPIPMEIMPLVSSLLTIVASTDKNGLLDLGPQLETSPSGWDVRMSLGEAEDKQNKLILRGCGNVLQSIEIGFYNQERRRIYFEPQL